MIGIALTVAAFVSAFLFPWPLTSVVALTAAFWEPLTPFAAGILIDALYWTPATGAWPYATLCGFIATAAAYFVRGRLRPDFDARF
jgi:hypothetical protein